jgi:hypothetical protein
MDIKQQIESANQEAVHRMIMGDPVLVDIAPAGEVIPGMQGKKVQHSGPPIEWARMCGAQQGAIIAMVVFEGWAKTIEEARAMLDRGEVCLEPNHHNRSVGPMAGTISPSLPVFVVKNQEFGNIAFCRNVEGRQQFGDYSTDAIADLHKWKDIWAPAMRAGVLQAGGIHLKPIIILALQMGDELHNRHHASSSLFANRMINPMIEAGVKKPELMSTVDYMTYHNLLFLGLAMASGKAIADPAQGIEYSTMVTAMCRNGVEYGIRVSGLGDEWFTAPAPKVNGLYLPGYKDADAGLDMGDSAITETVGWGGFVIGGAPGILSLVGGTPDLALSLSREMRTITLAKHPQYLMPVFDFEGAPIGIDVRKVVQTNSTPVLDTAIAHKDPGYPIIGAGLVRAPIECFKKALTRYSQKYLGK